MLDIAAVRALLGGTRFGDIHLVEETGSTNDDVLPLLSRSDPTPHTIVAEYQTHGRGRKEGRQWFAEPGKSLLWTTTLPPLPVEALWVVPFWAGLRIGEGIRDATELNIGLQWPNDILLDGRKLAGILCVSRVSGNRATVGIGVGLNFFRPEQPMTLEHPAAFVNDYAPTTREQVLACILHRFNESLEDFEAPKVIARTWEARAHLNGTPYRILLDGESQPFACTAKRLDMHGSLVVVRDGWEQTIKLGDARVVR